MRRFHRGEITVLVATSIVESGLDIPNANTLIVTDATAFGLAELHQLRGRIGRFTRQAYAYFLVPREHPVGEAARMRLAAIQEYAELGAGFKLALRDLELRGAGNLLGAEQSGHIAAIGYELYCRLLADAVARLQGRAGPVASEPAEMTLPVDAYVPDTYCEADTLKFELHKAIDGCRHLSELAEVHRRTRDRFGPPPPPLARLFRLKALRLRCVEHGIVRIAVDGRQIRLHLAGEVPEVLVHARVPEAHHVQAGDRLLLLFLRETPDQDGLLDLAARLLRLDGTFGTSAPAAAGAG
jgi:transcription-repair coupling factor (superfamily II helicase)